MAGDDKSKKVAHKHAPPCTLRLRRMLVNRLLQRKQFVVEILHQGRRCATRAEVHKMLAQMLKVSDPKTIFTFGFKTDFGGGRTVGFGLVYDNLQVEKWFEPKYRLARMGLGREGKRVIRKLRKDARKKARKQWGTRVKKAKEGKK